MTTNKIDLNNLMDSDYKALLQNDKVVDKLTELNADPDTLFSSEWLAALDGLGNYSLGGSYNRNYLKIRDSYAFLKSVLTAKNDYELTSDSLAENIEKVLSAYEDSEPSAYYDNKLEEMSSLVADILIETAKEEVDYLTSEAGLLEFMKYDRALVTIYGDDAFYNRENNKIYYTVSD